MRKKTCLNHSYSEFDDKSSVICKDRTFFCSELVAKALKILNVFKEDGLSSARFYPGHFSEKGEHNLNFQTGCSLNPEQIIELNES